MDAASFEALAARITRGLIDGDYDQYRSAFRLPLRIEPRDGAAYTLADEGAMRADWQLYRDAILTQGVTDVVRRVLAIQIITDDWIDVTVETDMLRNALRLVDPFKTQFVLRPCSGEWRIAIIRSSLGHINWTLGQAEIEDERFRDI